MVQRAWKRIKHSEFEIDLSHKGDIRRHEYLISIANNRICLAPPIDRPHKINRLDLGPPDSPVIKKINSSIINNKLLSRNKNNPVSKTNPKYLHKTQSPLMMPNTAQNSRVISFHHLTLSSFYGSFKNHFPIFFFGEDDESALRFLTLTHSISSPLFHPPDPYRIRAQNALSNGVRDPRRRLHLLQRLRQIRRLRNRQAKQPEIASLEGVHRRQILLHPLRNQAAIRRRDQP